MDPVLVQKPFSDPAWAFQPKWDGIRLLTDGRRHYSKRGRDLTASLPEVAPAVQAALGGQRAVLDGEFVVFSGGKPDFSLTLARLRGRRGIQGIYLVFDLLELNGQPLLAKPFAERNELLQLLLTPGPQLTLTPSVLGQGEALFTAIQSQGLEGIVAKRLDSPYLSGVKSELWRKVKVWQEGLFTVTGVTPAQGGWSLLLEGPSGEPAGRVFVRQRHGLPAHEVKARVAFLEWRPPGHLRQPRFLGWGSGPDEHSL